MPRGAWEAIEDVRNLERAIEDLEYRDNELRAEHMVHPGSTLGPCHLCIHLHSRTHLPLKELELARIRSLCGQSRRPSCDLSYECALVKARMPLLLSRRRGTTPRRSVQVPEYVLDRLAVITQPRSQTGARRLRALAFLAALIQLYGAGRHQLRLRSRESMQSLAHRVNIQVECRLCVSAWLKCA